MKNELGHDHDSMSNLLNINEFLYSSKYYIGVVRGKKLSSCKVFSLIPISIPNNSPNNDSINLYFVYQILTRPLLLLYLYDKVLLVLLQQQSSAYLSIHLDVWVKQNVLSMLLLLTRSGLDSGSVMTPI